MSGRESSNNQWVGGWTWIQRWLVRTNKCSSTTVVPTTTVTTVSPTTLVPTTSVLTVPIGTAVVSTTHTAVGGDKYVSLTDFDEYFDDDWCPGLLHPHLSVYNTHQCHHVGLNCKHPLCMLSPISSLGSPITNPDVSPHSGPS